MSQTLEDVFDEDELAAVEDTRQTHQERQEKQQDFLKSISENSDSDLLETKTTLTEGHTVNVSAKLNGELIDKLGALQERLDNAQDNERLYSVSEAADDASQLLNDIVENSEYDKDTFYAVYKMEGIDELGKMIERVFGALEKERERRQGEADGFRKK